MCYASADNEAGAPVVAEHQRVLPPRLDELTVRLARVMAAERQLPDADYEEGVARLGLERLAALTFLVGYYSALALALAVFRPALPESFAPPPTDG